MSAVEKLFVNVDGGSRGNPGKAAIGVSLADEKGNVIEESSKTIGRATNNIAEYRSLIEGCRKALEYAPKQVVFFTDSQLIANQINGTYETREPHLQKLRNTAMDLLDQFESWKVSKVERRANRSAHKLAEQALRKESAAGESENERDKDLELAIERLKKLDRDQLKRALAFLAGMTEG